MTEKYAFVGIPLPVDGLFAYRIPGELIPTVLPGVRVLVPYGRRRITGLVFRVEDTPPQGIALRDIEEVLGDGTLIPEPLLKLTIWTSEYYQAPLGEVISIILSHGRFTESRLYVCKGELFSEYVPEDEKEEKLKAGILKRGKVTLRFVSENAGVSRSRLNRLVEKGFLKIEERSRSRGRGPLFQALKISNVNPLRELKEDEKEIYEFVKRRTIALASEIFAHFGASGMKRAERLFRSGLLTDVDLDRPLIHSERNFPGPDVKFTTHQIKAVEKVMETVHRGNFRPYLLHGVTGSGKTEVYLEVAKRVLQKGRGVILLFPEIALAVHLLARIKLALGRVAVLHSGLTRSERSEYFERILKGEFRVVVGVRSAIFAPLENTGLIVVDEEHDSSYKQTEGVHYNARDVAVMRGKLENAAVILGSATPSLETYHNAFSGKYVYLHMPHRVKGELPAHIEVVEMKPGSPEILSPHLRKAIEEAISKDRQVLLLTHRRGYSPFQVCAGCGFLWKCVHCDVSLTYHKSRGILICHYCGYIESAHQKCPECGGEDWTHKKFGTQRVEEAVKEEFPLLRVARLDSDVASKRGESDRILGRFERGEVDVLVGTQMVAKGLDIPRLEVIGVISADTVFNLPDFRAPERGFQLLKQVLGRAGRREGIDTKVIIQTFQPFYRIIRYIKSGDDTEFYRDELARRRELAYPPFVRLALVVVSSQELARAERVSRELYQALKKCAPDGVQVLGPTPSPFFLLRGMYRYQIFIKAPSARKMIEILRVVKDWRQSSSRGVVRISVDVDPATAL